MSRNITTLTDNISTVHGEDKFLGFFFDIIDERYDGDPSGEGYLVEWSSMFGFSQNKIGIDADEFRDDEIVILLVDRFIEEGD